MENALDRVTPPCGAVWLHRPEIAEVMEPSTVYFILGKQSGLVKIGFARNAGARLSALQVGSTEDLAMLGMIETYLPHELEAALHAHFAADRVRGEWFRVSDRLVEYVEAHARAAWGNSAA